MKMLFDTSMKKKPFVLAGPCLAESFELMELVASSLLKLSKKLDFDFAFKASFDKANRTSIQSARGPGWKKAKNWFIDIKEKYHVPIVTDIHESHQAGEVAEICDILQIPAFLCRQTDLIVAAAKTGKIVQVKKGQFLSPEGTNSIVQKILENSPSHKAPIVTERGTSFGYGDLLVDMRGFKTLSKTGAHVCFDLTHSLQKPASKGLNGEESSGAREFAPSLARSACASSYLDGFFLEVHPEPSSAKSDKDTQLNPRQAEALLSQIIPFWYQCQDLNKIDSLFTSKGK